MEECYGVFPVRRIIEVRLVRVDSDTDVEELERKCNEAIADGFVMPDIPGRICTGDLLILAKWEGDKDEPPTLRRI